VSWVAHAGTGVWSTPSEVLASGRTGHALLDRAVTDLTQSDIAGAQAIYGQARSQAEIDLRGNRRCHFLELNVGVVRPVGKSRTRSDLGITLTVSPMEVGGYKSGRKQMRIAHGTADAAASVEPDRKCMGCFGVTNERGHP
jgi:hypothetical protein